AAHTAHFSIGSGTKLAMEDAIALVRALQRHAEVPKALAAYEDERRPEVERLQRAAQVSLEWFEEMERYHGRLEPIQFALSLLTRSLRVTHENLKTRDSGFVAAGDRWFAARAERQSRAPALDARTPTPDERDRPAGSGREWTSPCPRATGPSSPPRRFRIIPTARCRRRWIGGTWTRCATSSSRRRTWRGRRASTCSSSTWRTATCW